MQSNIETLRIRWLARRLRVSTEHARVLLELALGDGRPA
jgi:hypothetical protein